jgi:imidazolonepropionase-like amidohydrolase
VRDQDVTPAFIAALRERKAFYVPTLTRDLSIFVYESTPAFFTDPFFLRGQALYGEQIATLSDPARQQRLRADTNVQASKPALVQAKRNLQLLSAAGVAIAMGTDSGAAGNPGRWQGYFEHVELELMVESGLTPLQTLIAATSGAAQALGLHQQGSLERNKHADLIVLNADPLSDIKNTRQIHSVWLAGKQLDLSGAR